MVALGAGVGTPGPVAASTGPAGIHKIKHVIVIMQENRSFDSYFGAYPKADGIPMKNGKPSPCVPNSKTGKCEKTFADHADVNGGGPHGEANASGQPEPQGHARAVRRLVFGIEATDRLDRVPRHPDAARECQRDMGLLIGIGRDFQPELSIERQRSRHVLDDDADEVQLRRRVCRHAVMIKDGRREVLNIPDIVGRIRSRRRRVRPR